MKWPSLADDVGGCERGLSWAAAGPACRERVAWRTARGNKLPLWLSVGRRERSDAAGSNALWPVGRVDSLENRQTKAQDGSLRIGIFRVFLFYFVALLFCFFFLVGFRVKSCV